MDNDGVFLPLPPQPRISLLIQLQTPSQAKPYQAGPATLQIQPVPRGGGMDESDRDTAGVPSPDAVRTV